MNGWVLSLAICPHDSTICSGDRSGQITLISQPTESLVPLLDGASPTVISSVYSWDVLSATSRSGRTLVAAAAAKPDVDWVRTLVASQAPHALIAFSIMKTDVQGRCALDKALDRHQGAMLGLMMSGAPICGSNPRPAELLSTCDARWSGPPHRDRDLQRCRARQPCRRPPRQGTRRGCLPLRALCARAPWRGSEPSDQPLHRQV